MKRFAGFVIRNRIAVLGAFGVITVFFALWIPRLTVNSDMVSYLPEDDAAVRLFHHMGDAFNQNDLVLVAMEADDVFSLRSIEDLVTLTRAFQAVDGVTSVMSLSNVPDIRAAADGGIEVGMLVDPDALPSSTEQRQALRNYVLSKERYRDGIVSADGRAALLICRTRSGADTTVVVQKLRSAAAESNVSAVLHFGGNPMLVSELGSVIFRDFQLLLPIVVLLIIVTLFLTFGTLRGVLIPLASVTMSTVWLVGFMGLTGIPLTLLSDVIPAILMAIGTAPCIHLLSKYDEDPRRYGSDGEETRTALSEVSVRIVLAAFTIVLGFSSFIVGSYLTTIRDFGILASIGVVFSLLISVMFVPALLASIRVAPRPSGRRRGGSLLVEAMRTWAGVVARRRGLVVAVSGILLVLGILAVPLIRRESDFVYFLPAANPLRRTEGVLQREFGGSRSLQVDFRGDLGNPFVLQQMLRLERFLAGEGLARNPISIADLLMEMNALIDGARTLPDDSAKVANLMFLLEGQEIVSGLITADSREGQVQAMVGLLETRELEKTVKALDGYLSSMPTRLLVMDLSALPPADRGRIAAFRAADAAKDIGWIVARRAPGRHYDGSIVATRLRDLLGESARIGDQDRASSLLLGLVPEDVAGNPDFSSDLRGIVASLSSARVAVPESVARELSADARSTGEPLGLQVGWTGMPLIGWHLDQSVLESQAQSLLITVVVIFALLAIKLRSWRAGLMGLAPIGAAIVVMFGLMGAARIPINVATVLVGSIALGIGIDYSIHFSVRFTTYYRGEATPEDAVTRTMATTGQAIVINVLAVTMGFVALLFAYLLPLKEFGLLTATAMIGSGLGALSLLPALVLIAPGAFARAGGAAAAAGARTRRKK